jgi:hypothetical protein
MTDVFKTIIVPAVDVQAARDACALVEGGQGMFSVQLTTDVNGAPPATHYASSGAVPEDILPLMWPSSADVSDEPWQEACARVGVRMVVEEV